MKRNSARPQDHWSANDFVLDESFCNWVIKNDPEAAVFWQQWINEHPHKKTETDRARSIIRSISFQQYSLSPNEVTQIWERARMRDTETTVIPHPNTSRFWLKIAASLLLCIAIGLALLQVNQQAWIIYNTAFGETKSIVLPDSSVVTLNANSVLKFRSEWDGAVDREVWIDGEAFFSVVHKKNNQRFKVHTGDGVAVEVLGTTFNVFHRTRETRVVLNTGKIRLSLEDDKKKITMKPGEMIELKEKSFSRRTVNPSNYSAWLENKVILDRTSLREMISMMQDNYGVEVSVADKSLLNQTVSGSMPTGDAEEMVDRIALAFQLNVRKEDNIYLLSE